MSHSTLQLALRAAFLAKTVPYVHVQGRDVALITKAWSDSVKLRGNGEVRTCASSGEARDVAARVLRDLAGHPHLGVQVLDASILFVQAARRFRALRASRVRPRRWGRP